MVARNVILFIPPHLRMQSRTKIIEDFGRFIADLWQDQPGFWTLGLFIVRAI